MATDRARPAQNAGEREMLTGWLEHHRGILIWKCENLTAEQLRRRAVQPSTLSLLGLVRHMAGVERARWDLWGSEAVRRRGAKFLPQLAEADLWVAPEELEAFVAEVRALLADVDGLRAELGRGPDCLLPHYLGNFLLAAEYAHDRGGGINIT